MILTNQPDNGKGIRIGTGYSIRIREFLGRATIDPGSG